MKRFLSLLCAAVLAVPARADEKLSDYFPPSESKGGWRVAVDNTAAAKLGVDPESEQRWQTYAISLLAFSFVSLLVLYAQLRLQGHLPLNPNGLGGVKPTLSFNTSVSVAYVFGARLPDRVRMKFTSRPAASRLPRPWFACARSRSEVTSSSSSSRSMYSVAARISMRRA